MILLKTLFLLVTWHSLADFPLQGEATAINKNPDANTSLQKHVPWYYWLLSHAIIHGGGVTLITGSFLLGVLETISHFWIDYGKCKRYFSIHEDQLLHIFCKILWTTIFFVTSK